MTEFPTLYKRTSAGAVQQWMLRVDMMRATIHTAYGQIGGKVQTTADTIKEGKNIGRANATNAGEQALAEARARWEKKRKSGYVEDQAQAARGEVDDSVVKGGVAPMLAQKFAEHGEKITYPAFIQPKLDGVRCIATLQDGKATLWTRTRKPITSVPHIVAALESMFSWDTEITLDGELYVHHLNFERLVSLVRPVTPRDEHREVEYHIYDLVAPGAPFSKRLIALEKLMVGARCHLVLVPTMEVVGTEDVTHATKQYLDKGYEGSIVRQATTLYEVGKRSMGLQKVKQFQDGEYHIVGVEEGRGKLAGCAIFVCETKEGRRFNCKLEGDIDRLRYFFFSPAAWQGKMLTVRYQNLTADGIPRFPVGVMVRDYE
jgi:DNA ligase-1